MKALFLIILTLLIGFFLFKSLPQKLGGTSTYIEVPKYIPDTSVNLCYRGKTQITYSEYKNIRLNAGETAFCTNPIKLNVLKDGEFFFAGKDEASSTLITVKRINEASSTILKSNL